MTIRRPDGYLRARLAAGALFFVLITSGCAATQTAALLRQPPARLPASAEIASVPFFPQQAYQCGPASLAMTLSWAGAKVTPEALAPKVFIPEKHGSLQVELIAAARRYDMLAYVLQPELADLLAEVAAGHPVIVFQNLGLSWYPVWHFAVVTGYDLAHRRLILHSGPDNRLYMPMSTFEHTWARGGYWALLTLPPSTLPQTASEPRYLDAVIALEQTGHDASAAAAYRAALTRWPQSETAGMGLGNSLYAMGRLKEARAAFLQLTRDHPDSAAAFNNLAQTEADLGDDRAALAAARRAVEIGGPLAATFRKTLADIQSRLAHTRKGRHAR
ncbi:MAG TPA: PA2778 family cysteine peptidase [Mariprofundaceae bacterium]|nr:PA2778 family cysteine peptidase [Mariprofundaceae bacterium]